jgi:RimJ/RimL family protein N-acetyltransferase
MEYFLKGGKTVVIRKPVIEDAEELISVIATADRETLFLARNPDEFCPTVEEEKNMIAGLENSNMIWFVAEYDDKIVGQCSVGLVNGYQRYRHRASVAFVVLAEYCNIGIGGRMMEECLKWCADNKITQVELGVVATNERALSMYRDFGFEVVGTIPNALRYSDGSCVDEYNMIKFL